MSAASADLDPAKLSEITNKMVQAVTHPSFIEAMRAVLGSPDDQRLAEASQRLSPDALRSAGVPLPTDMRISSRYFEQGYSPVEVGDMPEGRPNIVNLLNEAEPGLLDRLRREKPDVFEQI